MDYQSKETMVLAPVTKMTGESGRKAAKKNRGKKNKFKYDPGCFNPSKELAKFSFVVTGMQRDTKRYMDKIDLKHNSRKNNLIWNY